MKNMKYIIKQNGFLMVEVLIAVVIITVALVSVAGMYIQSTKAGIQATDYTMAASLAQDRMERLKAGQTITNNEVVSIGGVGYTITFQNTPTALDADKLFLIQVTVQWVERGQSQNIVITTYLARNIP